MVQPTFPARTSLEQTLCELRDEIAALVTQIRTGGAAGGGISTGALPLVATLPGPSRHFRIWVAIITTTPAVRLLDENPDRLAFTIQTPSVAAIYVGDTAAAASAPDAAPIQALGFGLTNHTGPVYARAVSSNVTATIIEQWR